MDTVDIGRLIAVAVPFGALLIVLATVRVRVISLLSAVMAIVFLLDLFAFSLYALLSKSMNVVTDAGAVFDVLWSIVVRLHSAAVIGHYALSLTVNYAKEKKITSRDMVARLWKS